ncbi:hypothetical protein ACFPRL_09275 [Pseudoclavibacter helvolus]
MAKCGCRALQEHLPTTLAAGSRGRQRRQAAGGRRQAAGGDRRERGGDSCGEPHPRSQRVRFATASDRAGSAVCAARSPQTSAQH